MADSDITIEIEGKVYRFDDFELGDLEWLEDELGGLDEAHMQTMKATLRLVYLVKRRENPELTLDDVRKMKVEVLTDKAAQGSGKANGARPTKPEKRSGQSTPAPSGGGS